MVDVEKKDLDAVADLWIDANQALWQSWILLGCDRAQTQQPQIKRE